ncbi:MAG: Proton glutamate symport protein [Bacteroidetes bacterium ADurb.Bin397]|jgi:proton glutamate symport protein|nr:MAG: Proton glutamate symport protein [Bacteroidetes bacterium ADurb.Bin397]
MKLKLHWKILIGMALGVLFGLLMNSLGLKEIVIDWIKPLGTIFINCLKLIAMPLILASLITGLAELKDFSKLSKMGGQTILIYLFTTACAVSIGLILANVVHPGSFINEEARSTLLSTFAGDVDSKIQAAHATKESAPLQPLIDMVPDNLFKAMSSNGSMLQVIFFAILFGIGLILIPEEKARPVTNFFSGLNEVILKIIDLIMLTAPIGVFSLLAALIVEIPDASILGGLIAYALTVIFGLLILLFVFYPGLLITLAGVSPKRFFKAMLPAQLVAFSTSSSAATLPVTMECATEHLGVEEEVASFVLPLGATVNMDGTALYQAVAAIFIAQVMSIDLTLSQQLMIIVTATLASIGSAAVPGAGMVMLVIVLGQAGIPEAGLALIFAIDRPLDMFRTVINVSSDACVSTLIAKKQGMLRNPIAKEWDDNYKKGSAK